jgi:hypothetical protein
VADFEAAMRFIFGVTADSDISAVASIGTGPDMTLLGTLTLANDPTEPYHCCTKQYVDNTGGGGGATRVTVTLSSTQTVTNGSTDAISWDAAHIESGGDLWAIGQPTRIVAPVEGDYLITGSIMGSAAAADADFHVKIKYNGGVYAYDLLSIGQMRGEAGTYKAGAPFAIMESFSAEDYIEVFVYAFNNDQVIAVDSQVSMVLLGQ